MASLTQGFSRQILREFAAREQNEIIFIERAFTKDTIAANLWKKLKVFTMEEVRAIKPSSAASAAPVKSTPLILPEPSDTAASAAALLGKGGNKDPRKSAAAALLNNRSSTNQMISTTATPATTTQ